MLQSWKGWVVGVCVRSSVCSIKPCSIFGGYSPPYITSAVTTARQYLGEWVRGSINTLRKELVSKQLLFPCFLHVCALLCHTLQCRAWYAVTKSYWWSACVNWPSTGHSQLLWDPLPLLYNMPQCAGPFVKGQKWTEKWTGVKNKQSYKYQS